MVCLLHARSYNTRGQMITSIIRSELLDTVRSDSNDEPHYYDLDKMFTEILTHQISDQISRTHY